jgi:hypothetical protein
MNIDAVRGSLWKAIGLVSVANVIFVCTLTRVRRQWPSVAVRSATAVCLLLGLLFSGSLVRALAESSVRSAQGQEIWLHPSPIIVAIPAIVGAAAGGIYSVYLRQRESGRVA